MIVHQEVPLLTLISRKGDEIARKDMLILMGACAYCTFSSIDPGAHLSVNIFLNTYHWLIVNFVSRARFHRVAGFN